MKRTNLKSVSAFETVNRDCAFKYFIILDTSAGLRERYTVLRMMAGTKVQVIGCEIDMELAKKVIRETEEAWKTTSLTKRREFYVIQGFSKSDALAFEPDDAEYARLCGVSR